MCTKNGPDKIFPVVNFVFSHDGPFGLEFGLVLVWSAPGSWPHRLKVSEGLRHGGYKEALSPELPLSPGDDRHMGSAQIRSPRVWESIHRSLACASAIQPLDQPFRSLVSREGDQGGGGGVRPNSIKRIEK